VITKVIGHQEDYNIC